MWSPWGLGKRVVKPATEILFYQCAVARGSLELTPCATNAVLFYLHNVDERAALPDGRRWLGHRSTHLGA